MAQSCVFFTLGTFILSRCAQPIDYIVFMVRLIRDFIHFQSVCWIKAHLVRACSLYVRGCR